MTSFVNEFSIMMSLSQFIRTNCLLQHKIVQYVVWIMYCSIESVCHDCVNIMMYSFIIYYSIK